MLKDWRKQEWTGAEFSGERLTLTKEKFYSLDLYLEDSIFCGKRF